MRTTLRDRRACPPRRAANVMQRNVLRLRMHAL
jgi:hypothetical protein